MGTATPEPGRSTKNSTAVPEQSMASRAEARRLIREAKRIFVIYTSADLRLANDLRKRILRLRGRLGGTVFLAAESLPPGSSISPEAVAAELARADLVVVACGELTHRSPFVTAELRQAYRQRAEGATRILPVILKRGVLLPEGLDFAIHGIHRAELFPSIRWLPIATSVVLAFLAGYGTIQARNLQVSRIDRRIEMDSLTTHSPVDLGRVTSFEELRRSAQLLLYSNGIRAIDAKLAPAGREWMRSVYLPADAQRTDITADPSANVVWVGYADRIEAIVNDVVSSPRRFNFRELPLGSDAREVSGIKLRRLRSDNRVAGVLAEIDYNIDEGPDCQGTESVLVQYRLEAPPQALGNLVAQKWTTLHGRNEGDSDSMPFCQTTDHTDAVEARLAAVSEADYKAIRERVGSQKENRVTMLAFDPLTKATLVSIEKLPTEDLDLPDGQTRRDYWVELIDPKKGYQRIVPVTHYYSRKRELTVDDNAQWHYSDERPQYTPAALFYERGIAWIGDRIVNVGPNAKPVADTVSSEPLDISEDASRSSPLASTGQIEEIRWLPDGSALRVRFKDGSVGRSSLDGRGEFHRFLFPPGNKRVEIHPLGRYVLVLESNGQVDRWELERFGRDGWVGSSTVLEAKKK